MSSWCCSGPCQPLPSILLKSDGTPLCLRAVPYRTTIVKVLDENRIEMSLDIVLGLHPTFEIAITELPEERVVRSSAIVFTSPPGSHVSAPLTKVVLCDGSTTLLYVLDQSTTPVLFSSLPVLSPRSCLLRECTTSREQLQATIDNNILLNVQSGTWCPTPMSSGEYLKYVKALNRGKNVYTSSGCC